MEPTKRLNKYLFIGIIALSLSLGGCWHKTQTHGHVIKQNQIDRLKVGVHDRMGVANIMGTPSAVGTFQDKTWYYISEKVAPQVFTKEEVEDREIVILDFGDDGKLASISFKGKEDGQKIEPNTNKTDTQGQKLGVVDQVFQNLGVK